MTQWSSVIFGGLTLVVLVLQWWVFRRQAKLMERQGEILAAQQSTLKEQHALAAEQMRWRRDEAIGTFYRLAHDLVAELRKANVLPLSAIPADFNTHPRQLLREASRVFAPLGNEFVFSVNELGMRLDQYFEAVEQYNPRQRTREGADMLVTVQSHREQIGRNLDRASRLIPDQLRWKYSDGKEYDFQKLCSPPPGLLSAE